MMPRVCCAVAAMLGVMPCGLAGAQPSVTLRPCFISGEHLPGAGTISEIRSIDCTDDCWQGIRVIADSNDHVALWHGPGLEIIARANGRGPHGYKYYYGNNVFSGFNVGTGGVFTFFAGLDVNGVHPALIGAGPDGPRLLLMGGRQAPGQPDGVTISTLGTNKSDNEGNAMVLSELTGGSSSALYRSAPEGMRLIATTGDPAPGIDGAVLSFEGQPPPLIADGGMIVMEAMFTTAGASGRGIWRGDSRDSLALVAAEGGDAPGAGPGVTIGVIIRSAVGAAQDRVSFRALLAGAGVDNTNDSALFAGPMASPVLVAREGQPAPGAGDGVVFDRFESQAINNDATVVFEAGLRGPGVSGLNDTSIWRLDGGELRMLVREGDVVPGTAGSLRFSELTRGVNAALFMNSRGDVVFEPLLRAPDNTSRGYGLCAAAAGGEISLLARSGQIVDARGSSVTVNQVETLQLTSTNSAGYNSTGGADGRRTVINGHGEVFMRLRWNGGQGLFKAQVGVRPCTADFNRDDFVDCFDVFDFVDAFEAGRPEADFDEDDFIDFLDFTAFVTAFEEGC